MGKLAACVGGLPMSPSLDPSPASTAAPHPVPCAAKPSNTNATSVATRLAQLTLIILRSPRLLLTSITYVHGPSRPQRATRLAAALSQPRHHVSRYCALRPAPPRACRLEPSTACGSSRL